MKTVMFSTPAMYGDHHVTEVRKQLLALPGVREIYASSAFRVVEVTFEENQVSQEVMQVKLSDLGCLSELPVVVESGVAEQRSSSNGAVRQTISYVNMKKTVSFQQRVVNQGHPLRSCLELGSNKVDES